MAYSDEIKAAARSLYLRRLTPKEIASDLNLPSSRIVYNWAKKNGWADLLSEEGVSEAIERRISALLNKDEKSSAQLKELDLLLEKELKFRKSAAEIELKKASINQRDNSGSSSRKGSQKPGGKRKAKKNDISELTESDFEEWVASLFDYQRLAREVKNDPNMPRIRNILKSRQIGFTYGTAGEAFEDAVLTGHNQIFISATRNQAEVFRSYICKIALQFFELELTGNPIILSNGAELHFLSTNANSAQSRSGNVYIDEYFWIRDFKRVSDVVEGCSTHEHFHITYISTPSAKNHPAYPFWTGEAWRKGKETRANISFPSEKEMRDGGCVCPDQQWRYIINVYDAVKGGCHFINPDRLKEEKSPDAFANLYMCEFVDDSTSVFKLSKLKRLMVDPSTWRDFKPGEDRPFGRREVWLGYDPSRTRDNACLVVVAPPINEKEKFRVLEKHYWHGLNFQYQVAQIKKVFSRYNVTYLGMDSTGIGVGVHDMLSKEFPRETVPIHYSNETKDRLVLKMIDVYESERLQFNEEEKDIATAFMAIKRTATSSGNRMTFKADRSELSGHADVFWAIAHALINEPLDHTTKRKSTWATAA
ncbi:terminase large subunit domain-containing protein [Salinivibrio sp. KP-1]|uniref:terminase large subunit domain-containing protein n=1 Tax=Salinivibrio sp. KP-1 TaxID=1406902 RepID=UPI000614690A|nr:terminase family protein [Salinivibrio sp. KP-1]KKA45140.1 terminase [Salinivibrio sp. KP-1]